jgi:predicted metal-dependent phosphoesterase TrpH
LTSSEPTLIDLHVHTTESDGSLSPRACVARAAELGLAAIGVVDHDTIAGNAEAVAAGTELGVEVVPGVEVSADLDGLSTHILGYFVETPSDTLLAVLGRLRSWRSERNPRMLEKLRALGCPVDMAEVAAEAGGQVIGRPHIAAVLVRKGLVPSTQHAFDRYLGDGAAAYVDRARVGADEAIDALVESGAVPVLAHPGALKVASESEVENVVRRLAACGLRGLETRYSGHRADQTAAYEWLARELGLVVTGGSDFHGTAKPDIEMGSGFGAMAVPLSVLDDLKAERHRLMP